MTLRILAGLCFAVPVPIPAQVQIRDSAGVRIVSNPSSLPLQGPAWRLDATPRVLIGTANGADPELFNQIMGLVRQQDGHLIVANMGSNELRIFDPRGKFVRAVGRSGGGPGEFRQLFALFLGPADSLLAYDVGQGFSVFDPSGRYVRTLSYHRDSATPFRLWPYGWFGDGSQFAGGMPPSDRSRQGKWTDSMTFYRVDATGSKVSQLFRYPAFLFAGGPFGPMPVVFSPNISVAVWRARYCIGYGIVYEIYCADEDGSDATLIRRQAPPSPISAATIRKYQALSRSLPGERGQPVPERLKAQRETVLQAAVYAVRAPFFARFLAADAGELWVERYHTDIAMPRRQMGGPSLPEPIVWDVFDRAGVWIASVTLPPRFRPFQIGADYVLGVRLGEDDIEQVSLYALRRR